jgi:hypothetical protein
MEDDAMPNSTQNFNVNSNLDVTPNGNGAQMSRSGANNQPNQGQWHAASAACNVSLPTSVWDVTANDGPSMFTFSVPPNSSSATYTLLTNAPIGTQPYSVWAPPQAHGSSSTHKPPVTHDGLGGNNPPSVVVNP